jgi:hypothetical protein
VCIEAIDETHAAGISYCQVYRYEMHDGSGPAPMSDPELLCEYRNRFEKRAEGWRIVTHEARHIFRRTDYVQPLPENELARLGLKA